MSPERWERIKEVFHSALERGPGTRAAYLDGACQGDGELRAEVQSLLNSHEADPTFIEKSALYDERGPEIAETDPLVDKKLGPYRVIRPLAVGGMGAVYLAVRADEAYQKQVAIKLLRADRWPGGPRQESLRRFHMERQTLANLDHPHIARLLDGGTADDGTPYLVMDYIEGEPIDDYCDAHRLSTAGRLRLFRTVCDAVQYAHQRLVVHRDIKPSNILVTTEGTAKLLDFGIAKLLDSEPVAGGYTQTGMQPFTPNYASPEQVRGERITTSSDVYSLGIVLCELLSGHPPYRLHRLTPLEVGRVICEQAPEKPSTAMMRIGEQPAPDGSGSRTLTPESVSLTREGQPDQLRRRLTGDLDMIVLMALRKEPARRYASVEQFSEDIRRHLEGLPVIARPDTVAYRTSKFVRRHPASVSATALAALALVGAAVGTTWSAQMARRERDAAVRAKAESEAVTGFLSDMLGSLDPAQAQGQEVTVKQILDKASENIVAALGSQPLVEATLRATIGNTYRALGRYAAAEGHLATALDIRRKKLGSEHVDVAESLYDLARLRVHQGDFNAAEPLCREALALRRKLLGEEHVEVAASLNTLATILREKVDYAAAEPLFRQVLDMRRKLLGEQHPQVAQSLNNLAGLLDRKGDAAAAEPLYRQALELRRKLHPSDHLDVAESLNNLASVLERKRDYEAAEPLYHEALAIRRKLLPDEHPDLAQSLNNLALLLHRKRDYAAAEPLYRQALDMNRKLLGQEHPSVAINIINLAALLREKGEYSAATSLFREALQMQLKLLGNEHPDVLQSMRTLADLLNEQGEYAEAEDLLRRALDLRRNLLGVHHPDTLRSASVLAAFLFQRGKIDDARSVRAERIAAMRDLAEQPQATAMHVNNYAWDLLTCLPADLRDPPEGLRQSLRASELSGGNNPTILDTVAVAYEATGDIDLAIETQRKALSLLPARATALRADLESRLVNYLAKKDDLAGVRAFHREVLARLEDGPSKDEASAALSLDAIGRTLIEHKRFAEAEPFLRSLLTVQKNMQPAGHWRIGEASSRLGECLAGEGRFEEAEPLLRDGFEQMQKHPQSPPQRTKEALERLISLYEAWNRPEKVAEYRALNPG